MAVGSLGHTKLLEMTCPPVPWGCGLRLTHLSVCFFYLEDNEFKVGRRLGLAAGASAVTESRETP